MPKKLSRKRAREIDSPTYFTGLPCKHGHIALHRTVNYACTECELGTGADRAKAFRDRLRDNKRCPGGVDHSKPRPGFVHCDSCLEKKAKQTAERRDRLAAENKCILGARHRRPRKGHLVCDACIAKTQARQAEAATASEQVPV